MPSLEGLGGPASLLRKPDTIVPGLRRLPWIERLTMRRTFRGEELHQGSPQPWLDQLWDVRVGAVDHSIYKVSFEARAPNRADAEAISAMVFSKLQQVLGSPNHQNEALFIWDASDGNAVLQFANIGGDRRITLFLTSSIVSSFTLR